MEKYEIDNSIFTLKNMQDFAFQNKFTVSFILDNAFDKNIEFVINFDKYSIGIKGKKVNINK